MGVEKGVGLSSLDGIMGNGVEGVAESGSIWLWRGEDGLDARRRLCQEHEAL